MYGPFHRINDPPEVVRMILASGELWGRRPRNYLQSEFPKVKAYKGTLPDGHKGIEFMTDALPDTGSVPYRPTWSGPRTGVVVEGEFAKIKVHIIKENVL
jgi:hypothetical protein